MILSLLALLVSATACSKEKRMERRLHTGDGKWNIDEFGGRDYLNDVVVSTSSHQDAGYIVFEKNGMMAMVLDGQNIGGTWVNTEDMILLSTSFGLPLNLKIIEESKKELRAEHTEITSDSTKFVYSFKLSRAN